MIHEHRTANGLSLYLGANQKPHDPRSEKYQLHRNFDTTTADLTQARSLADVGPNHYDYRTPIKNQANLGACAAFTVAECAEMCANLDGETHPLLSAGWLYEEMRKQEGTYPADAGSLPEDGMDIAIARGVPRDDLDPYDAQAGHDYEPLDNNDATNQRYVQAHYPFHAGPNSGVLEGIWTALDNYMPISLCITWLRNWFNPVHGVLPDDVLSDVAGGHAITIWGIQPIGNAGLVLCANHWSPQWAADATAIGFKMRAGDFAIPFKWFTMANSPVWTLSAVTKAPIPGPKPQPKPDPKPTPGRTAADVAKPYLDNMLVDLGKISAP